MSPQYQLVAHALNRAKREMASDLDTLILNKTCSYLGSILFFSHVNDIISQ